MSDVLISKTLALESLEKAMLSPVSRMIAKLAIDGVPTVKEINRAEILRLAEEVRDECLEAYNGGTSISLSYMLRIQELLDSIGKAVSE